MTRKDFFKSVVVVAALLGISKVFKADELRAEYKYFDHGLRCWFESTHNRAGRKLWRSAGEAEEWTEWLPSEQAFKLAEKRYFKWRETHELRVKEWEKQMFLSK